MNDAEYIREQLPDEVLFVQLAEEATELAHAAMKLRRTYDTINPTPVTYSEALEALKEEIADVRLLLVVLGYNQYSLEIGRTMRAKLERWVQRLKEV